MGPLAGLPTGSVLGSTLGWLAGWALGLELFLYSLLGAVHLALGPVCAAYARFAPG
jgi:hypothetical protein